MAGQKGFPLLKVGGVAVGDFGVLASVGEKPIGAVLDDGVFAVRGGRGGQDGVGCGREAKVHLGGVGNIELLKAEGVDLVEAEEVLFVFEDEFVKREALQFQRTIEVLGEDDGGGAPPSLAVPAAAAASGEDTMRFAVGVGK